jgi:ketosteroid isomerase-like protein
MNKRDPKLTVLLFNECINHRDIEGLVDLMTDDHSLICNGHIDTKDKNSSKEAWSSFFSMFPDYLNQFSRIESKDDIVTISGKSTCSNEERLNTDALWSARVQNDKVSEWQVYEDSPENRSKLQIQ